MSNNGIAGRRAHWEGWLEFLRVGLVVLILRFQVDNQVQKLKQNSDESDE